MWKGCLVVFLTSVCAGQQQQQPQPTEGARELFFVGSAPKDTLPPVPKTVAPAKSAPAKSAPVASSAAAMHLGLRYTLVQVTSPGDRETPVDPERNFRKGDCLAMHVESNRSGYLYVLAKQSSGEWAPLFPTPELADQDNRIDPGQVVRAPKQSCFEIEDPPGAETLFVVLSRSLRDVGELADSMKAPGEKTNSAVNQVTKAFGTRELPFTEVVKTPPKSTPRKEPNNAVYVVSGSDKPATTLVTKVEIRHQ